MSIIYILIPISLIFLAIAVYIFFWAVDNGQFEDLDGPAYSILYDDDDMPKENTQASTQAPDTTTETSDASTKRL
ncbi:cytochrome oxidase maturation protein, cbb3-type [Allopseudospirillum japonicum]|uniref:Cytochrome oxidase maturation protein, cbb3-type n=1 Tax=Allopseudospirillum japonicum TaxID=64971 RepID=A0A1H6TFP3_9GAMM|nr:cbb3-type cytochrome oxidase assembly protein CcoS [Allopseudospirillum japonicum]SEI78811.1 cytochrome oxidase maturation protein, cbb3-type [Allopseudospirillum japonicum]